MYTICIKLNLLLLAEINLELQTLLILSNTMELIFKM